MEKDRTPESVLVQTIKSKDKELHEDYDYVEYGGMNRSEENGFFRMCLLGGAFVVVFGIAELAPRACDLYDWYLDHKYAKQQSYNK